MFDSFLGQGENEEQKRKTLRIKTVIIGGKNVGKTTIANALSNFDGFENNATFGGSGHSHVTNFQSTFVADVFKKKLSASMVYETLTPNGRPAIGNPFVSSEDDIEIALWDTAGYEAHEAYPPAILLNGSDVVLICFAVNDISSLRKVKDLVEHCEKSRVSDHCIYFVMGNKMDVYRQLCEKMISRSSIKEKKRVGRNGNAERGPFIFGDKHNVTSDLNEFGDELFYREAKEQFFEIALPHLTELQRALLNVNYKREPEENGSSSKKKQFDLLFSYTTLFCKSRCVHNPLFCILYATAVHLERKFGYSKYNEALTGSDGGFNERCAQSRNTSSISSNGNANSRIDLALGMAHLNESFEEITLNESTKMVNGGNKTGNCCT